MRNEYPRPQFQRAQWLTLNGTWDFAFQDEAYRLIEVPFVYQSRLSGIYDARVCDFVTYHRTFALPPEWKGQQILLHFGAVDYRCSVSVNGQRAGGHTGGHTPFTLDITGLLKWDTEEVAVEVFDPHEDETIPRGKQFWEEKPRFIWYTPSTGIWQSVWVEPVSASRFESIRFTPDIDRGTVEIGYALSRGCPLPCRCKFAVTLEGRRYFEGEVTACAHKGRLTADIFGGKVLNGPFHGGGLCWSPEHPTLFDVTARLLVDGIETDCIHTYFGMRKVSVENGKFCLNNYPYYQKLVLDQGYWPDSLLTAPEDQSFIEDIERSKAMGFNGCRKHEKVEDPRFLYWADRLGYLVWAAMPSFVSYGIDSVQSFVREWMQAIDRDYNHPSIVVWDMLNESWGVPGIYENTAQQSFSLSLFHLAKSLDTTRLVIGNDGWEQTESDICAIHSYRHGEKEDVRQQLRFAQALLEWNKFESGGMMLHSPFAKGYRYQGQPIILSEFGGVSCETVGEVEGWGYTTAGSAQEFLDTYARLIQNIYDSPFICGFCYTQLTDVEQEKNGLLSAQRDFKCDAEAIRRINNSNAKGVI